MKYEYTEAALNSLMDISSYEAEKIQHFVEEVAQEDFYNHNSYSFVYDSHGTPWDKLDLKQNELNYRIFFTKIEDKVYILEVFDRDEFEYDDSLYDRLEELDVNLKEDE